MALVVGPHQKVGRDGVSLEIGNFCTLSTLFKQTRYVMDWFSVSGYRFYVIALVLSHLGYPIKAKSPENAV